MGNKGQFFSPMGRFFPWKEGFSGARGGTEHQLCRIAPQLHAPLRLGRGILDVHRARSSELDWSEIFLVLSCIWWCGEDSRTLLCSWMRGAAQPALKGAPLVRLGEV